MPRQVYSTSKPRSCYGGFVLRSIRAMRDPLLPQILQAYAILLIMDLALRSVGLLSVWKRVRARCHANGRPVMLNQLEIDAMLRAVRCAAGHHLYPMKCLPQSLALAWLLARRGVAVDLRLGVSRQRQKFEAHAWLELDGIAINDTAQSTQRFLPLNLGSL